MTLKKFRSVCFLAMAFLVFAGSPCFAWQEDITDEVKETIQRFEIQEPRAADLFETAYGYMVFPRIEKGAAMVGGAYGEGLVYEQKKLVGKVKMTHLTLGVQIGGGSYAEVIFFDNEATMNQFRDIETVATQQAAAFGPHDTNSANISDRAGMSVFTMKNSGGFAEASAGVKKITFIPLAQ